VAATKPTRSRTPRGHMRAGSTLDSAARTVLIAARHRAKMTQKELARRLDWAQSYVSRIEDGTRLIHRSHFIAIARALGADPHALFMKIVDGEIKSPSGSETPQLVG
jgi:transcriptional regulator with XRE-family HTH domain